MKLAYVPNGVRFYREWFDVFARALGNRPQGILFDELCDWFFESGEDLGVRKPDHGNQEDVDAVEDTLRDVGNQFVRWGLVVLAQDHTRRRTKTYGFALAPEARMSLSKAGASLATRSNWVRETAMLRRILGTMGVAVLNQLRVPLAVLNLAIAVVRLAADWNTVTASVATVVAGALLVIASIARTEHQAHP